MPFFVSAETVFSAAHTLPDAGECARVHGHNWRVRVTVRVAETALDRSGMGIDFRLLEAATRDSVADFEHRMLNQLPVFRDRPPSAEQVSRLVYERLADQLAAYTGVSLEEVEIWEMPHYRVAYRPQ